MFKWEIEKRFNERDGSVLANIKIIESDAGCGISILKDAQGYYVSAIVLKADTWLDLNAKIAQCEIDLKNRIDLIRKNKVTKLTSETFKY